MREMKQGDYFTHTHTHTHVQYTHTVHKKVFQSFQIWKKVPSRPISHISTYCTL